MAETDGIKVYTEEDTDLAGIEFVPFTQEAMPALLREFPSVGWYAGGNGEETALVARVVLLGKPAALTVSYNKYGNDWLAAICQSNWGHPLGHCDTRDGAVALLTEWVAANADASKAIGAMSDRGKAFVREASSAGHRIRIDMNKGIAIEIRPADAPEEAEMYGEIGIYGHDAGNSGWSGYWYAGDPATARQHGFFVDVRKGFDTAALVDKARTCDRCGKVVPFTSLHFVGFANAACPECATALRETIERPGWCD